MKKVMWLIICCLLIMCSTGFAETLVYQGGGKQYFIDESSVYYAGDWQEGKYFNREIHVICRVYNERLSYSRQGVAKIRSEEYKDADGSNAVQGIVVIPEYDVVYNDGSSKHIHDSYGAYFSSSPSDNEQLGFFNIYIGCLKVHIARLKKKLGW